MLQWLHRKLAGEPAPRRLVYALPPRAPLEPVAARARARLAALGLADDIALHVVMAAREESHGDWRMNMHRPAIVVGTVETLLAKALNRGFDTGRALWPIDSALLTDAFGTAEPFTCNERLPSPSATATAPSPCPTWKPSSASPTGAPAPPANSRPD